MRKILLTGIVIFSTVMSFQISQAIAQEYKKLGKIYKVNPNRDIIISSPNAFQAFKMGDKVYIIIDSKPVIMTVTFPMMTIAKCRLNAGYENFFNNIYKGLQVYNYEIDIENKRLTDYDSHRTKIGNSSIIITAADRAKIYYLNVVDWENFLEIMMKSYGKNFPESNKIKSETVKAIRYPRTGSLQINLTDLAYTIGDSGENTPGVIKNLDAGDYYVWIVHNDEISIKKVTLANGQNYNADFSKDNKNDEIEKTQNTAAEQSPEEEKLRIFGMDWGIGANVPFYDQKDFSYAGMNWVFTSAAVRINVFFDFRFNISNYFSLGFETGINFFPNLLYYIGSQSYSSYPVVSIYTSTSSIFLDIPLRGFVRLGTKYFYAQIFGGYYIGIYPLMNMLNHEYYERGGELGARVNLRGFYIDFSYIFANREAYNIGHFRVGMGFTRRMF